MARGVAILGVKVTGIEPPRLTFVTVYRIPIRLPAKSALTFVTVYRLPIRLPAKSALTWPVV